ncbi:MAG: hypothetical protein E7549_03155 [Ruminococcaceae bacterium]|nr:hypothetical protein [Oscillospiraceae bacterium]
MVYYDTIVKEKRREEYMTKQQIVKTHMVSSVLPALFFGALAGAVTGAVVTVYKWLAGHATAVSAALYAALRARLWLLPVAAAALVAVGFLLHAVYRRHPGLRGGGIPTAVGAMRGTLPANGLRSTLASAALSLLTFLCGVPLGTEGPSVLLGTGLGGVAARKAPEKWHAWERYSMTGGACAGFSAATGAPLSGILFAVEEAHRRISPLIVLTAVVSVLFSEITSNLLAPLLGCETTLFSFSPFTSLALSEIWIPLVVGLSAGLFAVLFLRGYARLSQWLHRLPPVAVVCGVLLATLACGLLSTDFIATGHALIEELFTRTPALWMLAALLLVRSVLSLSANLSGITGGIFLPLMAVGAVLAALLGRVLCLCGVDPALYPVIVCLGIGGCIAGMMKMPLTAILFAVEALGMSQNLLPVILVCALAYVIPEALKEDSVMERVLHRHQENRRNGKKQVVCERDFVVEEHAFAVGKEVRDVFWPHGVFVLSVKKGGEPSPLLAAGDVLSVQIQSWDIEKTVTDLRAITSAKNGGRIL